MSDSPRFYYHAHAVALEGEVTHPFQEKIDVQAPSAVSPNGGYGTAGADPYNLRDVIMHKGARSRTEAGYNEHTDEHYALAHVKLDGFNISDMVTVDSMTARLTTVHSTRQEEPSISPHGSSISNLQIAGHPIQLIPLLGTYHTNDTMTKLRKYYDDNTDYQKSFDEDAYIGKESELSQEKHRFFPWLRHKPTGKLPEFRGHTIVPLFKIVDPNVPGLEVHSNVITVHNFGRIHVGELYISADERRVTMLRAELGSPMLASIRAGGSCSGGGQTDP